MMRDFPSCFGENGVQVADCSTPAPTKTAQNLVTCVYQCRLPDRSCLITITWTKNLMGQGLGVSIDDSTNQCLCKFDVKPWLFSKRKGCKTVEVDSRKVDIHWDLSTAKFGSGPEPLGEFYVALVCNHEMVLQIGDLKNEAYKKISNSTALVPSNAVLIAKREHIFGSKFYGAKAQFRDKGQMHNVMIECDTSGLGRDSCLVIRVDGKPVMQVKRLQWKFRGNQTIVVDGFPVDVFWDVYNWLFGDSMGSAVFMFQVNQSVSDPAIMAWSCLPSVKESRSQGTAFSWMLHAWRNE